jgi:hypothetical protein
MATDHPFNFNADAVKANEVPVGSTKLSAICTEIGWKARVKEADDMKLADISKRLKEAEPAVETLIAAASANVGKKRAYEAEMAVAFKAAYDPISDSITDAIFYLDKMAKIKSTRKAEAKVEATAAFLGKIKNLVDEEVDDEADAELADAEERPMKKRRRTGEEVADWMEKRLKDLVKELA